MNSRLVCTFLIMIVMGNGMLWGLANRVLGEEQVMLVVDAPIDYLVNVYINDKLAETAVDPDDPYAPISIPVHSTIRITIEYTGEVLEKGWVPPAKPEEFIWFTGGKPQPVYGTLNWDNLPENYPVQHYLQYSITKEENNIYRLKLNPIIQKQR